MQNTEKSKTRDELRKELREKLREKILHRQISRGSREKQEHMLEKTFAKFGIDKDKLKDDIEAINKQGGLTINI